MRDWPREIEAVAIGRDQPEAVVARPRVKLEMDLRHVDDDAVGIGEREHMNVDGVGEIGDEARPVLVADDAGRGDDIKRRSRLRQHRGRRRRGQEKQRQD